jgi:hypothetical protein
MHTGLWWRSLRKRVHLENVGVGRGKILKHIFKEERGRKLDKYASGYRQLASFCGRANDASGSKKRGEYLDQIMKY